MNQLSYRTGAPPCSHDWEWSVYITKTGDWDLQGFGCSEWALEGSQRWRIASQHMAGVRGDIADIGGAKHQ